MINQRGRISRDLSGLVATLEANEGVDDALFAAHTHSGAAGHGPQLVLDTAVAAGNKTGSGKVVLQTAPTVLIPVVADMTGQQHDHEDAAGGGQIDEDAFLAAAKARILLDPFHAGSGGAGAAWYPLNNKVGQDTATQALLVDVLYAIPFLVKETITLDRLALNVTTGGGAGSVCRAGIYAATSSRVLYPAAMVGADDLILDTSAAAIVPVTVNKTLTPGLYFLVLNPGVAGFTVQSLPTYQSPTLLGFSAVFGLQNIITKANAYAALPATFPSGGAYATTQAALAWARLSA